MSRETQALDSLIGMLVGPLAERLVEPLATRLSEQLRVDAPVRSVAKPMTVREAAQLTRLSERTIRRLIAAGRIREHRAGRRVLVMRDDVLAALAVERTKADAGPDVSGEARRAAESLLRRVK